MRRISRPQQPIDLLLTSFRRPQTQSSSSPCLVCNFRAISFPKARHPSTYVAARFSTSTRLRQEPIFKPKNPEKAKAFTDSIQAKLWGGQENVLGREDPYDRNSPMRVPGGGKAENEVEAKRPQIVEEEEVSEKYADELAEESHSTEDEYSPDHGRYEEAKTWHGLERVGSKEWAEEYQDQERGRLHFRRGYLPSTKITDPEALDAALHRAIAEVFTLQKVGMDLGLTSKRAGSQNDLGFIQSVKVGPSKDGNSAIVEFSDSTNESEIVQALEALAKTSNSVDTESSPDIGPEEASSVLETTTQSQRWKEGWQSISISDPDVKFAVVKRLMQLTGHRLSDPVIQDTNTIGQLLARITAPPKPKKLVEAIQGDGRLQAVSNVKVSGQRVTPMDKEQEVGRLKVIEYALRERGLLVGAPS
ncbi:uncharacterized protein BDZ99DRAFT_460006 [Mytilinidion resinicola]|uniref:Large ribosomal subunit protein mL50 n=1 Tax=Mytilinidion resinicola TaxID=574789 RepID=A0A6A6Z0K8_9PEZI|nr:uncharacterized protein BDZ99DRAFT_460006 [Mytilinidion resinicola]KAF2814328.1 hypothetical protein BDZ99DRAFT_460006 [Mytilinidion resinicola]